MRAPLSWLRDYVDLPADAGPDRIADMFVQLGFEVEAVHLPPAITGTLRVGKVVQIEELTGLKKPIRFCQVDVGQGNGPDGSDGPRGIICGATNFVVGDLVVVALPGTVLPGEFEIAARKTYGHLSDGMLCSAAELGIGTDHDGIIVLGHDQLPGAVIGQDAAPVIGLDEVVIELDVLPDRGYALSIRGLARELAAGFGVAFDDPAARAAQLPAAQVGTPAGYPIRIEDTRGCARFVGVSVSGVDPAAPSPLVIRRRLQACGVRSISLAVDVTNYVMLELGQPLHAYDSDTLRGPVVVRRAAAGDRLTTLDGAQRTLTGDEVLITDDSGAIGLAGVMGGATTEITAGTTNVLLEAATFTAPLIGRTARRQKLPSEASKRFERGVDPQVAPAAAARAAELLVRYGGGSVVGRTDVGTPAAAEPVRLPLSEPERLVGRAYSAEVITHRLEQIGATVTGAAGGDGPSTVLVVTPPTWRPDLVRPADLVEEIARLESYEQIPSILPAAPAGRGYTARQRRARAVAQTLTAIGLTEILTFPFTSQAELDACGIPDGDVRRRLVRLANPLDADRPQLRPMLLPGMLDTLARNQSRGARDMAVFEIGQVFLPRFGAPVLPELPVTQAPTQAQRAVIDAALPDQPRRVAAVFAGDWDAGGWWGSGRPADWADAIDLARRIGEVCGTGLRVVRAEHAPWHPGRCGELRVGDWPIGHAGELHPAVLERWGLPARTVAVELTLDSIPEADQATAPEVSAFPAVHVDIALIVDDGTDAATVAEAVRDGAGPLLESVRLFDVYRGSQVGDGRHSLAFSLTVRAPDRTLTAAEANQVRDAAIAGAASRCGAVVRG